MAVRNAIGVFDSGVGGLTVWQEIAREAPQEDILYLADQAHVPYGSRSLSEVQRFSEAITRFLLDFGVKVIVVACNTASAAALRQLRRQFSHVPFVGMEPAVKPAVERSNTGVVAVIATEATFQGELFASLLERYANGVEVLTQVCPGLVGAVEAGALEAPETKALLRRCLAPLIGSRMDQLVLGCTHYPFLRSAIEDVVGGGVSVVDPAPAVARQVCRVLAQRGIKANRGRRGRHVFLTSGDLDAFSAMLGRLIPSFEGRGEVGEVRWRGGRLEGGSSGF